MCFVLGKGIKVKEEEKGQRKLAALDVSLFSGEAMHNDKRHRHCRFLGQLKQRIHVPRFLVSFGFVYTLSN